MHRERTPLQTKGHPRIETASQQRQHDQPETEPDRDFQNQNHPFIRNAVSSAATNLLSGGRSPSTLRSGQIVGDDSLRHCGCRDARDHVETYCRKFLFESRRELILAGQRCALQDCDLVLDGTKPMSALTAELLTALNEFQNAGS